MTPDAQPRVLQVVGGLNPGGTEKWLIAVMPHAKAMNIAFDFLVHSDPTGYYESTARHLGAKVLRVANHRNVLRYAVEFSQQLRSSGPYQIVHSHLHHFSGVVLALAAWQGVPNRVAHCHSDTARADRVASPPRRLYASLSRRLVARYASAGFATSAMSAPSLFGSSWRRDARWRVLYCGVDLDPFSQPSDALGVRAELRVPASALLMTHVGSFRPPKNHSLTLAIAEAAFRSDQRAHLILVGDGPLRPTIENLARSSAFADRVHILGLRDDIARLLRASDVLLLPSTNEGLGLVAVEAQAAGLPVLASDRVTHELDVVPVLMNRLPLDTHPSEWARRALELAVGPRPTTDHIARIASSPFSARQSATTLVAAYRSLLATGRHGIHVGPNDGATPVAPHPHSTDHW